MTTDRSVSRAVEVGDDGTPASIDDYWRELVTAALLGTDRRGPVAPPAGPVADLVADAAAPDGAVQLLTAVAATAAVRRAAFVPLPAADPLQPPDDDPRPWCPPAAAATWRTIVRDWPVLEDEWVLTVVERGWRPAPDVLVELLLRHGRDPVRRARVAIAGGPLVGWLADHLPELGAPSRAAPSADTVARLPDLPIAPELAELLGVDAHTFVRRLVPVIESGGRGAAHRAVVVNLLARCRPAVLADAAAALAATHYGPALALADLARLRHRMLVELGVTP